MKLQDRVKQWGVFDMISQWTNNQKVNLLSRELKIKHWIQLLMLWFSKDNNCIYVFVAKLHSPVSSYSLSQDNYNGGEIEGRHSLWIHLTPGPVSCLHPPKITQFTFLSLNLLSRFSWSRPRMTSNSLWKPDPAQPLISTQSRSSLGQQWSF